MIGNFDQPVFTQDVTIKDIIEIVGREPLSVGMQNSWIVLQFDHATFKIKNRAPKRYYVMKPTIDEGLLKEIRPGMIRPVALKNGLMGKIAV